MVDAATLEKLEAGFKKVSGASGCKSLLKKYLTKEVFDQLKNKKTSLGATLLDVIQSGCENLDSGVGVYAPDAEAYSLFSPLFDPIIEDYHVGFKQTDSHPPCNFGDGKAFVNVDPEGKYVISTRVRCGRSMQGYPFNPCLTEAQYKEMEQKLSSTLGGLEGELKGTYYPLTGMTKNVQQQLIDDHFLFKEGDRFLQAANACRYWPAGRGIYHNDNKTFLVWCNEEDHLRIISMQMGGDLGCVVRRLIGGVKEIEKRIPFSHHDRLGFLTFCPTNLGTTVRASVHIKLPNLAANRDKLEAVAGKYNLQVRGTRGEHTEAEGGVYDISNKRRMGLTEFQAIMEMQNGILELIKMEKSMSSASVASVQSAMVNMGRERSLIAVKPDGVQRGLVGEIIKRFEQRGFKLVAMKMVQPSIEFAKKHYADLASMPFYADLCKFLASGPVVAMVWEGTSVIATGRAMMGETNPFDSKPGTIRGDYCTDIARNIIHGSDSPSTANREINLWFGGNEMVAWKQCSEAYVYES